ncbi:MAG: Fe-S cluster assembly protein SufD [Solirubrobacterales bacterium]|jgi:Fe-S cluster assembly protein SufD|nr:Fe-S cluster assembly protein SufD [Solirubrobacterales bacterium]
MTEAITLPPLPDQKTKGWEFTDLSGLDLDSYEPGSAEASIGSSEGAVVLPLAEAAESRPELVEGRLGSLAPAEDPFVARNDAAWSDGVLVHVPAGVKVEEPIRIEVPLSENGSALNWRTLIVLEEGAEAEVWEHWSSPGDDVDALLNSVVELSVGQAAALRYVNTQDISESAWIFATQRAQVERDGRLDWAALGFGSARGKVRMETNLAGAGSEARVTGGYAGGPGQHLDYDTTQEHAAPNTNSDLAFRGVLAAGATAVWRGMIRVDPGAQQTDAFQESRNLLLSTEAHADAIPGLEIEADDVRCTHAAAVAQIDRDQLFYLTSRGLAEAEAKSLIIEGFLESLVERLAKGPVREEVSAALERRLAEIL